MNAAIQLSQHVPHTVRTGENKIVYYHHVGEWIDTIGSNSANRKYTTVNYTTDVTEITSEASEVSLSLTAVRGWVCWAGQPVPESPLLGGFGERALSCNASRGQFAHCRQGHLLFRPARSAGNPTTLVNESLLRSG